MQLYYGIACGAQYYGTDSMQCTILWYRQYAVHNIMVQHTVHIIMGLYAVHTTMVHHVYISILKILFFVYPCFLKAGYESKYNSKVVFIVLI